MKIILIRPNSRKSGYQKLSNNVSAIEPPLWLLLRAQTLRNEGCDVEVYDLEVAERPLYMSADKFEVVLWGSNPSAFVQQKEALEHLKNSLHGPLKIWETLPEFDPSLPPAWDLLDLNSYRAHMWHSMNGSPRSPYGVLYTSYGCPFSCNFCNTRNYYKDFYQRPLDDVLKDILALNTLFNTQKIKIIDEMFFLRKERVEELCDRIISENLRIDAWAYARIDTLDISLLPKLKKAGINWLGLGIESGSPEIRQLFGKSFTNEKIKDTVKALKDNGIYSVGNFMFGFPDDSITTMQETLDLALELNCEHVNFNSVMAYPGTLLEAYAKKKGWEIPFSWSSFSQYSYDCFPLRTKYMSSADVLRFRDEAFQTYFTNENYLKMIKETFGEVALGEIKEITKISIGREIYGS